MVSILIMDANTDVADHWRKILKSKYKDIDIFEVIEHAIVAAALDRPTEFLERRDRIAETLFGRQASNPSKGITEGGICKEINVNIITDDCHETSHYSFDEVEAVMKEIEEEDEIVGEVMRIYTILANSTPYESEGEMYESLRRLQLMALPVEILEATEIRKAVYSLRKHWSKRIRDLVRTLNSGWKNLENEWAESAHGFVGADLSFDSVINQELGLPCPPLEDEVFFLSHVTTFNLSQIDDKFFDGVDVTENELESDGHKKTLENVVKTKKPLAAGLEDACSKEVLLEMKLESTKRKLQEGYKKAEEAKKRRKIQIIDLPNLPKPKQEKCRPNHRWKPKMFKQSFAICHH